MDNVQHSSQSPNPRNLYLLASETDFAVLATDTGNYVKVVSHRIVFYNISRISRKIKVCELILKQFMFYKPILNSSFLVGIPSVRRDVLCVVLENFFPWDLNILIQNQFFFCPLKTIHFLIIQQSYSQKDQSCGFLFRLSILILHLLYDFLLPIMYLGTWSLRGLL